MTKTHGWPGSRHERIRAAELVFRPWVAARKRLDPTTSFNVTTTVDAVGGNSGSPLVGVDVRLVGLMFDLNIHALGWEDSYDSARARSIAVTSTAILEALSKVYGAEALAREITRP